MLQEILEQLLLTNDVEVIKQWKIDNADKFLKIEKLKQSLIRDLKNKNK